MNQPNRIISTHPAIDAKTKLYAVIGNPIEHSMSPAMHNAAFATVGYPGILVAFRVTDIGAAVDGIRGLGIGGTAVTIPHKVTIIPHLDFLDPTAEAIGAVNTVRNMDGRLSGYNSDCNGAMKALLEKTTVQGKRVAIIGAGGAARAIGFGVKKENGDIAIYNRTRSRGESLASALGARFMPLTDVNRLECDILVNASSIGMYPDTEQSIVPRESLQPHMVVMDMVYNPLRTALLKEAEARGCTVLDGLAMFVRQGAFQFELWTGGCPAPVDVMRETVFSILSRQEERRAGFP